MALFCEILLNRFQKGKDLVLRGGGQNVVYLIVTHAHYYVIVGSQFSELKFFMRFQISQLV